MSSAKTFPSAQRLVQLLLISLTLLLLASPPASAQDTKQTSATGGPGGDNFQVTVTPSAFSYQGNLSDNGSAANGLYDMQFKLFDAASNGNPVPLQSPLVLERPNVQVTNGVFTVQLDFGINNFDSSNRYLDISVRHAATSEQYTTLAPRQQILSAPYAIRSNSAYSADFAGTAANSSQLGGFSATQYVKTDDARLADARQPAAGSNSYIQNTTQEQVGADFNIGGNGTLAGTLTANTVSAPSIMGDAVSSKTVNATTQYGFNNQRILTANGTNNLTVGIGAGHISAGGFSNSFFGNNAGTDITTGSNNTFVGESAGKATKDGQMNSFFGKGAGVANLSGSENSFFGTGAGAGNTSGGDNSFFGTFAGNKNSASGNSFFGSFSGADNTSGADNAFFGNGAGRYNTTGKSNSFYGANAGQFNDVGENNSFFGKDAGFLNKGSYNSFFGGLAGTANTTGAENVFVGSTAGKSNTTGNSNVFVGSSAGPSMKDGSDNTFVGYGAGLFGTSGQRNTFVGSIAGANNQTGSYNTFLGEATGASLLSESNNTLLGYQANGAAGITNSTAIGNGALVTQSNSMVLGNSSVSVGIGVTAPRSRLQVNGGNIYVGDAGQGIILRSPNGATCRLLTINDAGAIALAPIACP